MKYKELLRNVRGRGKPPVGFLDELVAWLKSAPEEIFAPNKDPEDVFNRLAPLLGPWKSPLHRRAAMGELLRCLAGFESSWKWNCGVDTTNKRSMKLITGQETGIFQVSYDSLGLDLAGPDVVDDLHQCAKRYCYGGLKVQNFIDLMKTNHVFAFEYCARLLRNSFFWDGPIKRKEIDSSLSKEAVAEFELFLSAPK
ncbi:MAG: hypothetical protein WAW39_11485 [Prosthecobacter sp.]|uniref:hypothetical protein n=1 Tax=Prosthecobacter sp. TaxID=1965333 RepID=UPI003BB1D0A4